MKTPTMKIKLLKISGFLLIIPVGFAICLGVFILVIKPESQPVTFPDGKTFGFSIFDDTDYATVEKVKPVYDALYELGIITTKSVWPLPESNSPLIESMGQTLSNDRYLHFILDLQKKGFEIAYHSARAVSSKRKQQIEGWNLYKNKLGAYPIIHVNHSNNRDNLYWGRDRFNLSILKWLYDRAMPQNMGLMQGHIPESDYFWGDIVQENIIYMRNFVFKDINTQKINPSMPFHDPSKPYVKYWFSSSDGSGAKAFNTLLSPRNLDRLEKEKGVCIVYTHFAYGFVDENGELNQVTRERLRDLSSRNGYFVPVSQLLDHLKIQRGNTEISWQESVYIQLKWMIEKIRYGSY
ncbi:MAG: hypothetical protein ACTSRA_19885 [Promethearchaeota archaeon]